MDKKGNITLRDYYHSLPENQIISPRRDILERVAKKCGVSLVTVRNWFLYGYAPRDKKHLKIISKETGLSIEALYNSQHGSN